MKEKLGYKRKLTPTSLTILDPAGLWVFVKLRVRTFLRLIEGLPTSPPVLQSNSQTTMGPRDITLALKPSNGIKALDLFAHLLKWHSRFPRCALATLPGTEVR
jgi:hypothetical protein